MVFHSSYCRKMTMETALTIGNGIESFLGAEDIHVTMTDKETHCHGILMNIAVSPTSSPSRYILYFWAP